EAVDGATGAAAALGRFRLSRKRVRDGPEVDDRRGRRVESGNATRVRLDLAQTGRVQAAQARDAVRTPAPLELLERRHLGWVDGDDQLPAAFVTNRVFLTEAKQRARTAHAQARLERTRRVIDPDAHSARA